VYAGFRCGSQRERGNLGDPGIDGGIIIRWIFKYLGYGLDRAGSE
jgi:hypothetical protein